MKKLTVLYGAAKQSLEICANTPRDLYDNFKTLLGIPADASVRVNGSNATMTSNLRTGDEVEFYKETGTKGSL
jgi:hypothetical protein